MKKKTKKQTVKRVSAWAVVNKVAPIERGFTFQIFSEEEMAKAENLSLFGGKIYKVVPVTITYKV